jgi:hypothetical protein
MSKAVPLMHFACHAFVRPANPSSARAVQLIIANGPAAGPITSPASWKHRLNTAPGWKVCRRTCETVRSPKHYKRFEIWTSPSRRRSSHLAASAGTDLSHRAACTRGSAGTPARRCVSLSIGTPCRAAPYGVLEQAAAPGALLRTLRNRGWLLSSARGSIASASTKQPTGEQP